MDRLPEHDAPLAAEADVPSPEPSDLVPRESAEKASGFSDNLPASVPKHESSLRPAVWLLAALAILAVGALPLVAPTVEALRGAFGLRFSHLHLQGSDLLMQRSMEALTFLWFFMLGGSFGSFLHCLEYRLPRGISLVASGSRCPHCGTKIKLQHNLPIFGWLTLGGRCAACAWAIPARYAATELVFACSFVLLAAVELAGGGMNLPVRSIERYAGVSWTLWSPNWELIAIWAYHASLLTFLMTLTLFAHDRHSKGGSIPVVALWIGVCGPLAFPRLQLVPLQISLDPTIEHAQVLITSLVGCIEGVLLSFALLRRCRGNVRQSDAQWAIAALSLSGLFLGWQASVTIALLTVVTRITACLMPIHWQAFRFPLAGHIAVATSIQLLLWRPIVIVLERADGRMPLAVAAFAVVTTLVLSRILDLAEAGAARIEDAPVKPVFIEHDFT